MKQWKTRAGRFNLTSTRIRGDDDRVFLEACAVAKVAPDSRQRRKYQQGRGRAWSKRNTARKRLVQRYRSNARAVSSLSGPTDKLVRLGGSLPDISIAQ